MTFLEKVNDLSVKLLAIKEKFDGLDRDALLKSDLEELLKLEELLNFYINTVVELVIEENAEFVKDNKELVKRFSLTLMSLWKSERQHERRILLSGTLLI